jgi:S-adenosylmethionine decarboxylase
MCLVICIFVVLWCPLAAFYSDEIFLFEAVEKKAEIILATKTVCLLNDIEHNFWYQMVSACQASIVSTINTTQCKAFILSESSLFIWKNRLMILTCGTSPLINAVEFFMQQFKQLPLHIIYQRQQELSTAVQVTSFDQDVIRLNQYINGQCIYLYTGNFAKQQLYWGVRQPYNTKTEKLIAVVPEANFEWCGYQLSTEVCNQLMDPLITSDAVRRLLEIAEWLENQETKWIIDDYSFSPYGYSLNVINQQQFITLHLTPEQPYSYISVCSNSDISSLISSLINVLQPKISRFIQFTDINNVHNTVNEPTTLVTDKRINKTSVYLDKKILVNYWLI